VHHCSFFFQQRGDRTGGWTFNLWNTNDDVAALTPLLNVMAAKLQAVTGKGCNVVKVRYSKFPGFREADEILYSYAGELGTDVEDLNADYQTTSVHLQMLGVPNYKVTQWLSGISDKYVYRAGRLNPAFKGLKEFKALVAELTSGGNAWTLWVLDKSRAKKVVKAISNTGVVQCTGHGFDGTTDVRVSRVKGNTYPNRIWRVENIDTNSFQLIGFSSPIQGGFDCTKAIARLQTYINKAISGVNAKRATSHRRGKPTDLLSGKSKTRA
jgi:hypothetical protein